MEEHRQLESFLRWLFAVSALCTSSYFLLAFGLEDDRLFDAALVSLFFIAGVLFALYVARRGKTAGAAAIAALSILIVIIGVLPIFPYAWPTFSLAAILAIAIVLPYLRGKALGAAVVSSFAVGIGVSIYGSFFQDGPTPVTMTEKSVLVGTKIAVTTLLLLLLVQFVQRFRRTLAETLSAFQSEQRARARAERLAGQTRRLQEVTSHLSRALPQEEIARIVLEQGTAIAGADTAALWLLDGRALELVRARNYPDNALPRVMRVDLDSGTPVAECVLRREPIWLTTREDYAARYPESEGRPRFSEDDPQLSICCIPLGAEDRVVGVMSYGFFEDRPFDEAERAVLVTLAHHCAQALEAARLLSQERAARELARSADRKKDEFLALLGHELRNPLAPIATAIEVMKLRGTDFKELPILERQVRHLIGLVDDLLDVSRVTRGKIRLDRKRIDVASTIDDALEMTAPLMEQRSHSLAINAPRGKLFVDADPRRLAQVIANLLTNAARYTEPGGKIRVRAGQDEDRVFISVEDNGMGIDPMLIPTLFEPFAQGEQAIDRASGGLGLGLMLVKSLTELHGGDVVAHSEGIGRGSRFTVRIPAAYASFDEETPVWMPPIGGKMRQRVLIVDDNRDAANTLGELLEAYGCEVAVAFDGPSALEVASAFHPTIAILDIGLPVMDGYELCRRMRDSFGDGLRMLALSGYGQEQDRDRSADAGFAAHLVKPIDAAALMAALDLSSSSR